MPTEHDLRQALLMPTDEPVRTERLHERIVAETRAPARHGRPVLVLMAAALLVAVLAGVALTNRSREATPVEPPTPMPVGRERVDGNWRMVHRIDLPLGWRITNRSLSGSHENIFLKHADDEDRFCYTDVSGAGRFTDQPTRIEGGTVQGRPAYTVPEPFEATVYWQYGDDAWAGVQCTGVDSGPAARAIAENVVMESTALRLPLRLDRVPEGYRVAGVSAGGGPPSWSGGLNLVPEVAGPTPEIRVSVEDGESDLVGKAEVEEGVVAGYPALLHPARGEIHLDAGAYVIRLHLVGPELVELTAGRRAQLAELAGDLVPAPVIGDPDTWFDAEDAVPS